MSISIEDAIAALPTLERKANLSKEQKILEKAKEQNIEKTSHYVLYSIAVPLLMFYIISWQIKDIFSNSKENKTTSKIANILNKDNDNIYSNLINLFVGLIILIILISIGWYFRQYLMF